MDFEDYAQFLFFALWALYMLVRRGIRAARVRKARQEAAQREQAPSEPEGLADEEEQAPEEEEEWWEPGILEEEFQLEPGADVPESELAPEIEWEPPPAESVPVWEEEIPSPPPLPTRAPSVARRRKGFCLMGAEPLPLLIRDGLVVGAVLEGRRRSGRPRRGFL